MAVLLQQFIYYFSVYRGQFWWWILSMSAFRTLLVLDSLEVYCICLCNFLVVIWMLATSTDTPFLQLCMSHKFYYLDDSWYLVRSDFSVFLSITPVACTENLFIYYLDESWYLVRSDFCFLVNNTAVEWVKIKKFEFFEKHALRGCAA